MSSQGSTRLLHDVQGTDKRKMFLSASGAFVYLVPMNQPNLEKKTSEARDKIGMRSCHRNYPNDWNLRTKRGGAPYTWVNVLSHSHFIVSGKGGLRFQCIKRSFQTDKNLYNECVVALRRIARPVWTRPKTLRVGLKTPLRYMHKSWWRKHTIDTFSICDAKHKTQQKTLCIRQCPWIKPKLITVLFVILRTNANANVKFYVSRCVLRLREKC